MIRPDGHVMIGHFGKARQAAQRIEPIVENMDLHRRIPLCFNLRFNDRPKWTLG